MNSEKFLKIVPNSNLNHIFKAQHLGP
uniref:Uncharacterized protein n=1 Tax=Rhizophora mucronata TaxID=61149 RepID=A0A2P2PYK5_RHIMU